MSNKINNIPTLFEINSCLHDDVIYTYLDELNFDKNLINLLKKSYYNDAFIINGKDLNKEQSDLLHNFLLAPCVDKFNIKFIFIYNFDLVKKSIQNTFLKEFENPNNNLYIFLTCSDLNHVIETIKSRTLIKIINDNQPNEIDFKQFNPYKTELIKLINTQEELTNFLNSSVANKIYEVIDFFNNLNSSLVYLKNINEIFKNCSYFEIKIILVCLKVNNDDETNFTLNNWINNLSLNPTKTIMFYQLINLFIKE